MKEIAGAIIVVLGIVAFVLFSSGRIDIDRKEGWIDWDPATPQSTLDASDAAANATMVAQQQSAQMTASAAQSEMQATAQAAVARATEQAMIADQARLDQAATRQAESMTQVANATTGYERFVATATSAAEATKEQGTVVARTTTRQVEVDDITATAASIQVTVDYEKRTMIETEIMLEDSRLRWERFFTKWLPLLFDCILIIWGIVLGLKLSLALLRLFQHKEEKCKKKNTPSLP